MPKVGKRQKRRKPVEYPSDPLVLAQAIFRAADAKRDKKLEETARKEAELA